ncbi:BC10 family protein [Schizosaccharomyces cryophilus OY26]|uniref:BC10 family protein n=1 Tax=Schizosaccharomyces cryophilus (strain OY26 / ATCC MYA-4695 / CBS 11777 / NBRC 106824 / NRRL Y48691) TaxID=653667 RepID=S9W112_SCHCR|nr:BC10 family protein [Schizosaccharomyces cryophilus OY26]EPY52149.1 BC10 family protein [Schizosaccharomyces cryophilus OY26]
MLCLRYFIPMLLVANAAPYIFYPVFILATIARKYPCPYCMIILAILINTRSLWSDSSFFTFSRYIFDPKPFPKEFSEAGYRLIRLSWLQWISGIRTIHVPWLDVTVKM